MDARRDGRVARRQPHPPARAGGQEARHEPEDGSVRCHVRADLERSGCEGQQVGRAGGIGAPRVIGDMGLEPARAGGRSRGQVDGQQRMVDQVGPDPGQVHHGGDAEGSELCRGADPGASQHHRTGVGAGRQHHAVRLDEGPVDQADAARRRTREVDAVHLGVGTDGQVGPPSRACEVGERSARTHTVTGGARRRPCPHGSRAVVVRHVGVARGQGTLEERRLHGVHLVPRVSTNEHRAVRAVPLVDDIEVRLEPAKVVDDVGPCPARVAERRPPVVVLRCAAEGEARVGGRAPTHDPGSWDRHPVVEVDVSGVAPVVVDGRRRGVEHVAWPGVRVRVVGPASRSRTLRRESSLSRAASTQPAEPPPTTTTSYAMVGP